MNAWDRGQAHISLVVVGGHTVVHCGSCGAHERIKAGEFMAAMRQLRRARDRHLQCALDHRRGNVRGSKRPTPGTKFDARSVA